MNKTRWLEISIEVPVEYVEPVSELFRRNSDNKVVIEEMGGYNPDEGEHRPIQQNATVRSFIPINPRTAQQRELIRVGLQLIRYLVPLPPLDEREIEEEDWEAAWKAGFTPLKVGQRLVVQPTWIPYDSSTNDIVIQIDPGLAFGTGHHPTTRRVLESVERFVDANHNILDIGSGSAILSIAAAKLGAEHVIGLEIDDVALRAGTENIRINDVSQQVHLFHGTLPHPSVPSEWANLILANISGAILIRLAADMRRVLKPDGHLVGGGILADRRIETEKGLVSAGFHLIEILEDDDWITIIAR